VALIALGWVAYGAQSGFPSYWQAILESVTSIVTVIMLFAIQHLQARDQIVTQRKLDELIRAIPQADNRVIAVEHAPDEELEVLTEMNRQDRLDD
jgi:low affinity Fe/Cu permease